MKASHAARAVASNTLARVRRDRERGKVYPCLDHAGLALAVDSVASRKGRAMVCEHCDRFLAFGDKVAHALSPSLHKVRPSQGYVAGNLALLCMECNTAIGEAEDIATVDRKMRALAWQRARLEG
jgi:hypothetical protein